ncbi:restriction endonuclease subunit S [Gordonia amicalis]|uniref:restriction endonuclease subunit S n=1 Tax=Gordonia amicalis TaxID=89053 RepID=UPI0015F5C781|nr:restriction endonuclease subunit S [Gordonia amicalis]MBA5846406.1 restriction endonuclease subunit S [Gordonia amicalis]
MGDVSLTPLSEVAEVTVGFVGSMTREYVDEGIPFLRSLNVRPYRIEMADIKYIGNEFHTRIAKSKVLPGDVVMVRTGKPGQAAVVPKWLGEANCSDLIVIRPGPDLNNEWLAYFLNGMAAHAIAGQLVGAVQQHFNVKSTKELLLPLPPRETQNAIAEVLGALDDKLAANEQVLSRTRELFAAMWQRAIAEDDSTSVPLSSLARFVNGRAYTKNATGTGRVVVRIAELNSGLGASTVYNEIDVPDDNIARPGDLLFAWSGSLTVARWHLPEAIVNQHIFKVLPLDGQPRWVVEQALLSKLSEFRNVAADKATTMGHIQRRHLDEPVCVPSSAQVTLVGPAMQALSDQIDAYESENFALAHTRDQLLPLLMSGKVTVKEAETEIADLV